MFALQNKTSDQKMSVFKALAAKVSKQQNNTEQKRLKQNDQTQTFNIGTCEKKNTKTSCSNFAKIPSLAKQLKLKRQEDIRN